MRCRRNRTQPSRSGLFTTAVTGAELRYILNIFAARGGAPETNQLSPRRSTRYEKPLSRSDLMTIELKPLSSNSSPRENAGNAAPARENGDVTRTLRRAPLSSLINPVKQFGESPAAHLRNTRSPAIAPAIRRRRRTPRAASRFGC